MVDEELMYISVSTLVLPILDCSKCWTENPQKLKLVMVVLGDFMRTLILPNVVNRQYKNRLKCEKP